MHVVRIIEYFPPRVGGMERHGFILSQEQVMLGHQVDVFIGFGSNELFKNTYRMPFQFLPLYSRVRRLWFNFWAYNKVKKIHKKNPYDIIHLHGDFIEAYFGGKLSKKLDIPAVITIHAGLNKRLLKPKNARYFENIAKIICVSEEIAKDLKEIGVPDEKIKTISSGVYLDEFKNTDKKNILDLRGQYFNPIIISVGVLRINKGFDYLIEAFKQVKQTHSLATLLIIGDGSEKNNLQRQAQTISNVHFLGNQKHDKIIEYLEAADVFVLASISTEGDREGTPTSIMEAMAAGLPVVATKVGGSPYLVKDNFNGILAEEKSGRALACAIIKLIENKNLAEKFGKQNLEDVKNKDWPIIAKQITDLYPNDRK